MFDIAPSELLLVAIVALLVIGPKDLPLALRTLGKWIGKVRRMSNHFRAGVETMIREAELAEIEKEWRERNARIMAEHPDGEALETTAKPPYEAPMMEPLDAATGANAESALTREASNNPSEPGQAGEPELPLQPPAEGRG